MKIFTSGTYIERPVDLREDWQTVYPTDEFWTRVGKQTCLNWKFKSVRRSPGFFQLTRDRYYVSYSGKWPSPIFIILWVFSKFNLSVFPMFRFANLLTYTSRQFNVILHFSWNHRKSRITSEGTLHHVLRNSLKERFGNSKSVIGQVEDFPSW